MVGHGINIAVMSLEPWLERDRMEAGCDEAGRGCLAGPVTAAAVILSPAFAEELVAEGVLDDSKKLNATTRNRLRQLIEKRALAWSVAHVEPAEIDRINILQASFKAMRQTVHTLSKAPSFLLIDGNRFVTDEHLPAFACVVKGDGKYASIAAASVLAKTHRDEYMQGLSSAFPGYGWASNAGYPTQAHREAIRRLGVTEHHRRSFRQLPE